MCQSFLEHMDVRPFSITQRFRVRSPNLARPGSTT